jgi:D-methionine transport system permease protein
VEAARAMGATRGQILCWVLLPEALPSLVGAFTVTVVSIIDSSAMAGAVGAGGLGDLAMRFGYQRFDDAVMVEVVIVLIAIVTAVQVFGDTLARALDRR